MVKVVSTQPRGLTGSIYRYMSLRTVGFLNELYITTVSFWLIGTNCSKAKDFECDH